MKQILLFILVLSINFSNAQDISTFPYFTGFEGVEGTLNENSPTAWTAEDLNTVTFGNQGWQIIKNSPLSQNSHTDSTAVHMFSHMTQANDDWLFTPSIQMTAGNTYTLKFWYKSVLLGSTSEKLKIHAGTTNNGTDMLVTTALWENTAISNDTYIETTIEFTPTSSNIFYFGFHYFSAPFQSMLVVDDVTIDEFQNIGINSSPITSDYHISNITSEGNISILFSEAPTSNLKTQLFTLEGKL
ncbi:choice-of-anchor J domain-containing protein, partial [Candidatus Venteria ishoeyi]